MGVFSIRTLRQPLHKIQALGLGHRDGVAVEDIDDYGVVAVGSELVGHKLGVLPDAEDVGDVEEGDAIVLVGALGLGDVGIVLADLDDAAGGLTPGKRSIVSVSLSLLLSLPIGEMGQGNKGTNSCLTPTAQHFPGGLEAIVI